MGASGSYLLVNHSPHGTEEIQNLLFATLIGAEPRDVWFSLGLVTSLLVGLYFLTRPLLLTTLNPRFARSIGIPVKLYSTLFSIWLGLMIGYSLVVSGLLFTFACLILPALIAKNLAKALTPVFFVTPIIAVVVTFLSFVIAHHYNLPPGHVVTLSLAILFTVSALLPKKATSSRTA